MRHVSRVASSLASLHTTARFTRIAATAFASSAPRVHRSIASVCRRSVSTRPLNVAVLSAQSARMSTTRADTAHVAHLVKEGAVVLTAEITGKAGSPSTVDLVFYHGSNCPDGFAAAFAAWQLLGDRATYVPVEHPVDTSKLPSVVGKHVVCVDYAFNAEITARMLGEAASFLVLDHHASAVKELAAIPEANKVFEMLMSGATLSYSYFHSGKEMPLFFRYLEDKDIWRWAFRGSEAFSAAYSSLPSTFEALDTLARGGAPAVEELIARGESIVAYKRGVVASHVSRSVPCVLKAAPHLKGRIVNASSLASEIGNSLCVSGGADVGVVWAYDHVKAHIYVSLRSDSDAADVSVIAKSLGGGGHKRASGFTCTRLEDVLSYGEEGDAPTSGSKRAREE